MEASFFPTLGTDTNDAFNMKKPKVFFKIINAPPKLSNKYLSQKIGKSNPTAALPADEVTLELGVNIKPSTSQPSQNISSYETKLDQLLHEIDMDELLQNKGLRVNEKALISAHGCPNKEIQKWKPTIGLTRPQARCSIEIDRLAMNPDKKQKKNSKFEEKLPISTNNNKRCRKYKKIISRSKQSYEFYPKVPTTIRSCICNELSKDYIFLEHYVKKHLHFDPIILNFAKMESRLSNELLNHNWLEKRIRQYYPKIAIDNHLLETCQNYQTTQNETSAVTSSECAKETKSPQMNENQRCKCNFCDRTYTTWDSLNRHMKARHLHRRNSPRCEICHMTFTRKDTLNQHRRKSKKHQLNIERNQNENQSGTSVQYHSDKPEATITGRLLSDDKYGMYNAITTGTREQNTSEMFFCQNCQTLLKGRSNFHRHRKIHFQKQAKCMLCCKIMKNDNQLKKHLREIHGNVKCPTCTYRCANKTDLKSHKF